MDRNQLRKKMTSLTDKISIMKTLTKTGKNIPILILTIQTIQTRKIKMQKMKMILIKRKSHLHHLHLAQYRSNQKKYEEQIISFTDEILQKNDNEFSLKLKKKVNLSYQAFFVETNSLENDAQTSIINFFLRISEFISTQNVGIISEKTANLFIRELMRINSIDEEISEILKFLNKEYKDNKKDLKEKIKILNEKNDHLNIKKQTYETKKDELKMFMEENKEKYNMEKNKINNEDDNKIQNVSFISEGNNNNNNHIMLAGCRSGFKKNSVKIKKINFDSINNSKNKLFFSDNNESNDLNISKDMAPNSDRQIIDNLNKYLINSLQINSKSKNKEKSIEKGNKKIVLHKNSYILMSIIY